MRFVGEVSWLYCMLHVNGMEPFLMHNKSIDSRMFQSL